jgi:hypothetical protein
MSSMHTGYSSPQLRASDADRDAVLAQLSENFQAGRLTSDEFDDRSGRALSARTVGELDALLTDLPATPLTGPVPDAGPVAPSVIACSPGGFARLPLVVIIVGVVVLAGVLGKSGHHNWDFWWIIPIAALIVRRAVRRRHGGASAPDRRPGGRPGIGGW